MKRIFVALTFLALFLFSPGVRADTMSDLIGLGTPSEVAELIVAYENNGVEVSKFKIKIDADSSRIFTLDASSDTAHTFTFGDAGTTAAQNLIISASTADADDDSYAILAGGGAAGTSRGGYLEVNGNEVVSIGGQIDVRAGNTSTGNVFLSIENASSYVGIKDVTTGELWQFQDDGDLESNATNGGHFTMNAQDKNFSILAGATIDADVTTVAAQTTSSTYIGSNSATHHFNLIANIADTNGTSLNAFKTRAAANSWNANTIVASGDDMLTLTGYGADGADYDPAARILMESGGTPGAGTDMPGQIVFQTTPDGSATLATALTITSERVLSFPGTITGTNTSNLGWVAVAVGNQACNTTCTSACVIGFDITGVALVSCDSAAADSCICAGAS